MKKLLLTVLVLAGLVLPSMAKDCEEIYHWNRNKYKEWEDIGHVISNNDLECLEYLIYEENLDLSQESVDSYSPAYMAVDSESEVSFDILSLLVKNRANLTEDKASGNESDRGLNNAVSRAVANAAWNFGFHEDFNTLPMRKLQLLLTEGGKDIWNAIHYSYVQIIIDDSMLRNDPLFLSFLLDQDMPLSEYPRYISAAKSRIKQLSENAPEKIQEYHVGIENTLRLLEESRNAKLEPANERMRITLQQLTQENMEKYNYSF